MWTVNPRKLEMSAVILGLYEVESLQAILPDIKHENVSGQKVFFCLDSAFLVHICLSDQGTFNFFASTIH